MASLHGSVYIDLMAKTERHRTTVDIEVDAFEEARALLGTKGYHDTVNAAMREVVRLHKLRRLADKIRKGELTGLPTPEELHELRHRRTRDIVSD
jgi:Arc/MetJ family transcription regulator